MQKGVLSYLLHVEGPPREPSTAATQEALSVDFGICGGCLLAMRLSVSMLALYLRGRCVQASCASQVQYRMHPALSAFPNTRFYAGRLVDGVQPHQCPAPKGLRLPVPGVPMVMLDVQGQESWLARSSSMEMHPA
eukprot:1145482-Pelagomonas_calceolata.AAC.2